MNKVRPYRIALLSSGLGHIKRGIETWTEDLGKALQERGVNVTVYKGGGESNILEKRVPCLKRDGCLNRWIIKCRPGFLWRLGLSTGYTLEQITFSLNLLPLLIAKQYDIIHTQDPQVASFFERMHKLGLIKSKIILAHGTEEPFQYLAKLDYIQHLAPYHLEEMKSKGYDVKNHFAIGNFVDTESFKPGGKSSLREELHIPASAFVVVCVAAIRKFHKRMDYLIDEVSRIKDEHVYLVVAGSTDEQTPELVKWAKTKLGNRVRFLENFPRARIQEVYSVADIFVLTSLKEMMPIALLEALSSGLPCLVHQYPVEEWMIGSGGETLDMSKPGKLAQIISMYLDANYRKQKSSKAREQAVENFSKEKIIDELIEMYDEVVKR